MHALFDVVHPFICTLFILPALTLEIIDDEHNKVISVRQDKGRCSGGTGGGSLRIVEVDNTESKDTGREKDSTSKSAKPVPDPHLTRAISLTGTLRSPRSSIVTPRSSVTTPRTSKAAAAGGAIKSAQDVRGTFLVKSRGGSSVSKQPKQTSRQVTTSSSVSSPVLPPKGQKSAGSLMEGYQKGAESSKQPAQVSKSVASCDSTEDRVSEDQSRPKSPDSQYQSCSEHQEQSAYESGADGVVCPPSRDPFGSLNELFAGN